MSSFAIASGPSNAAAQFFLPEINLKSGQWSEVFAAFFGFTTIAALIKRTKQGVQCDAMLDAEAVVLDPDKVTRRLGDFGVTCTPTLLTKMRDFLSGYWTTKRMEKSRRSPRFVLSAAEYLEGATFASRYHHPPAGYFMEEARGKVQIPSASRWTWNARIATESSPKLPMGELEPSNVASEGSPPEIILPVRLDLTPDDIEILSPSNFDKLGDGFFAYVILSIVGPRGVRFNDLHWPERYQLEPVPWLEYVEANTLAAIAEEEADEEGEEDDGDEEEDEYDLPDGACCINHPDTPAVEVWGGDPLCEDCAEHYVDGYRERDD